MVKSESNKLRPEATARGLFLPWPLLASLLMFILTAVIVPLWIGAMHARHVALHIDDIRDNDRKQQAQLQQHEVRITVLETRRE